MSASTNARHRSRGFTLIEVAVAMAIVGIGVVTTLQIFNAGLRTERGAAVRSRAVMRARDLMERAMTVPELVAVEDRGEFGDGYRWERRVREARDLVPGGNNRDLDVKTDLTLYEIEISVLWPQSPDREGVYTLRTLRIAPAPPA